MQAEIIAIDEAQRFPDIGLTLKRLVDANEVISKPVKIFATGSSSLSLAEGIKETAVGRLVQRQMWPLSISEIATYKGWGELRNSLSQLLVYGTFPSVYMYPEMAWATLRDYIDGVLFKDLFALSGIRLNRSFEHLVKLLAYRVGSEVNYDSLSRGTGINRSTVQDYVTLLEQCFLIRVCNSYSTNLSNELKKGKKLYFCDNGIRNAIINDFSPLSVRNDAGALWENFFFMERTKFHSIKQDFCEISFWRTKGYKNYEIDFIEKTGDHIRAFECKLSDKNGNDSTREFKKQYPNCELQVITPNDLMSLWMKDNGEDLI